MNGLTVALTVYGIKSCDTCRKALKWLDEQGREYRWHDLRADGLDAGTVQAWIVAVGTDTLVNRRSTTWRGLDEATRAQALDDQSADTVLVQHPTLIKRPVLVDDTGVRVGFNAAVKDSL